jgi:putative transposase
MEIEPIEEEYYYHIYNRGINGTNIFKEKKNFGYFLYLYSKFVGPIADTFAYCLLRNHFHFLVRIKEKNPDRVPNPVGVFLITKSWINDITVYGTESICDP